MLVEHPSGADYTWSHSRVFPSCTRFARNCDDPKTDSLHFRLVGAVSLLGGGRAVKRTAARGELKTTLESLAAKTWTHPVTGREVRFAAKTLERWLYRAAGWHWR